MKTVCHVHPNTAGILNEGSEDLLEFFRSIHLDIFSALKKFAEKHVGLPQ